MIKEGLNDIKLKWKKLRGKGDMNAPVNSRKTKMSSRLASLLVYTVGIRFRGLGPNIEYAPEQIFSLSENTANKLVKGNMIDLVKHTDVHLVRVYPKGTRLNSTNYLPHHFWASGCQVVAINWQTFGKNEQLSFNGLGANSICFRFGLYDKSSHVPAQWSLGLCSQTSRSSFSREP